MGRPVRVLQQSRRDVAVAWTRVGGMEVMGSGQILDLFRRTGMDLLMR